MLSDTRLDNLGTNDGVAAPAPKLEAGDEILRHKATSHCATTHYLIAT